MFKRAANGQVNTRVSAPRPLSPPEQLLRDRKWNDGHTFFYEKEGYANTDTGELLVLDPADATDGKLTVENYPQTPGVVTLSTGGDGSFEVWGVFSLGEEQNNNLALEYRIVIQSETHSGWYRQHQLTSEEVREYFRLKFNY